MPKLFPALNALGTESAVQRSSRPRGYGKLDVALDNRAVRAVSTPERKRDSDRRPASTALLTIAVTCFAFVLMTSW